MCTSNNPGDIDILFIFWIFVWSIFWIRIMRQLRINLYILLMTQMWSTHIYVFEMFTSPEWIFHRLYTQNVLVTNQYSHPGWYNKLYHTVAIWNYNLYFYCAILLFTRRLKKQDNGPRCKHATHVHAHEYNLGWTNEKSNFVREKMILCVAREVSYCFCITSNIR